MSVFLTGVGSIMRFLDSLRSLWKEPSELEEVGRKGWKKLVGKY